MLLTLIKKQLLGSLASLIRRDNKHSSLFKSVGYSLLFIYVLGILAFMSVEVMSPLCEPLIQANLNWFYFVYVFVLGFTYSVVGGIFSAKSGLYEASDNELLLSLPIPPLYILISRMIPLYLYSFLFSNLVMIPAFVVYGLKATTLGVSYNILNWIILVFVLPLLPLVVSCILGWILAKISSKVKFKNIITIVISLGFMVGYYYLISKMNEIINNA
ncbi:MAG: hypothetical protein HUJ56_09250, partial [Erysipelotrichaceae bacterium]|nr:hypothetical protein [Erysipelotrichaceae bacterium]